jgi:pimeloyl-ACP methyl ester carboxylesterase
MILNDTVRQALTAGHLAHLVTLNNDGSPQVSIVWVGAADFSRVNQSILAEKTGPPAWKQLPTWYQISESDHMIPPNAEGLCKTMNATTSSVNASHASLVSQPDQTAQLILNTTKGNKG